MKIKFSIKLSKFKLFRFLLQSNSLSQFSKKTQIRLFNFTKIRTSLCAHERRLSFCLQKRIHNVKGTCDSESTCLYLAVAIALIC